MTNLLQQMKEDIGMVCNGRIYSKVSKACMYSFSSFYQNHKEDGRIGMDKMIGRIGKLGWIDKMKDDDL